MNNNETDVELYQADDKIDSNVELMDSLTHITEGMYAKFKETPDQSQSNSYSELYKGDILLIQKLHYADGSLHSIRLKDHPRNSNNKAETGYFTVLFANFYKDYDLVSKADGKAVRAEELSKLNKRIEIKQNEFSQLEEDPKKLQKISFDIYSKRISSPNQPKAFNLNNVVDMLGSKNATEQIQQFSASANMATDLMKIQFDYLQKIQQEILDLTNKVMPYVVEHAASGLASVQESYENMRQMNDSVASMELFNGVGVEVYTICTGEPASSDIPLTLMQERLWADAELAFFNEAQSHNLDATNLDTIFFSEFAKNPALVNQIFPTQRCVCIMAAKKESVRGKDERKDDLFYKLKLDVMNREVFLLIRNGENIHVVYSPISSHLAANNLFPSRDSLEKHFFLVLTILKLPQIA